MKKGVLVSIDPYYVFLIIARIMGWKAPYDKVFELRKNYPKAKDWSFVTVIYCTKNIKSFMLIPEEYREPMKKFFGKVVGQFICASIIPKNTRNRSGNNSLLQCTGLTDKQILDYLSCNAIDCRNFYLWHITELQVYDDPKEISSFNKCCLSRYPCVSCKHSINEETIFENDYESIGCNRAVRYSPQNYMYIEVQ